jgi:hypothetical protein
VGGSCRQAAKGPSINSSCCCCHCCGRCPWGDSLCGSVAAAGCDAAATPWEAVMSGCQPHAQRATWPGNSLPCELHACRRDKQPSFWR